MDVDVGSEAQGDDSLTLFLWVGDGSAESMEGVDVVGSDGGSDDGSDGGVPPPAGRGGGGNDSGGDGEGDDDNNNAV